jgi:AhpC/TSA antioxidant enzyme
VGGLDKVELVVDEGRTLYAAYGLGFSTWWHVLNPWSLAKVFQLGKTENIWNRPTESGSRWQTAGIFAIDETGVVRYAHPAQTTDDLGDIQAALKSLNIGSKK